MTLCPECGEPPHYHSWCTRCAKLFMTKPEPEQPPQREWRGHSVPAQREWRGHREAMIIAMRLAFADRLTKSQAAKKIGCSEATIDRWRRLIGLPSFRRRSWGRPPRALDS